MEVLSVPYLVEPLPEHLHPTQLYRFFLPFVSLSEEQGQVRKFQQFQGDVDAVQ
jgi:hypothetical protein